MKKTLLTAICSLLTILTMANKLEKDLFKTKNGKKLEISFIKHASLMISFDGKIIHIDPISEYADYQTMPKADLILITHDHYDHLDLEAIKSISTPNTEIVLNQTSFEKLGKGKNIKNGEQINIGNWIDIEAVPAYNTTEGRDQFHPNNGRDNGYIITLDGTKIYIAGDTEEIKEMANLKDKHIDILFLPVNQPYTMTPEQAISAAKKIAPKVFYPYHYGDTDIKRVKDALTEIKMDVRIREME